MCRSGLNQDRFRDWPVFWAHCGATRLYGQNLVPLSAQGLVFEESIFGAQFFNYDDSCIFPTTEKEEFLPGRWTSIASRWDKNYWHFLMDALPRLSMLNFFPEDTGILVRGPISPWQWELFELLGVKAKVREVTEKRLMVEDYYFASPTAMTGTWNPFAVEYLRKNILESCREKGLTNRKIYIRRGRNWNRGIENEEEVCAFFEAQGWMTVQPETLTVRGQIALFSRAEAVCGLHGSALTNILWAPPGCRVLELCADNFLLGSFEWLARCLNQPHNSLIFPGNSKKMIHVDCTALKQKLTFES